MAVAGENAGRADPEDVDVVALADAEHEGFEGHVRGLRHPVLLIAIKVEDAAMKMSGIMPVGCGSW